MSPTVMAAVPAASKPPDDAPPTRTDGDPPDGFASVLGASQAPTEKSQARSADAGGNHPGGDSAGKPKQGGCDHASRAAPAAPAAATNAATPAGVVAASVAAATTVAVPTTATAVAAAAAGRSAARPVAPGTATAVTPAAVAADPAPTLPSLANTNAATPAPGQIRPTPTASAVAERSVRPPASQAPAAPAKQVPAATGRQASPSAAAVSGPQPDTSPVPRPQAQAQARPAQAPAQPAAVPPTSPRPQGQDPGDRRSATPPQAVIEHASPAPPATAERSANPAAAASAQPMTTAPPAPAAAAPSQPAVPEPLRAYATMQSLVDTTAATIRVAQRNGRTVAEITLHPAELGSVRVTMEAHQDGGVSATVTAQTAEAAQALAQSGRDLRMALEAQGMVVHGLQVEVAAGDGRGREPGAQQQPPGRPNRVVAAAGAAAGESDEITIQPTRPLPAGARVDVLA